MSSPRKPNSVSAKCTRLRHRALNGKNRRTTGGRTAAAVQQIPPEVRDEIERQRDGLLTIITLLHSFHVMLEARSAHSGQGMDIEFDTRLKAAARCAYLPAMTTLLLERTHDVFSALDSVNLEKAL